jgi:hypothetical protein
VDVLIAALEVLAAGDCKPLSKTDFADAFNNLQRATAQEAAARAIADANDCTFELVGSDQVFAVFTKHAGPAA